MEIYVHKLDKDGKCAQQGKEAEDKFADMCSKHDVECKPCSVNQNKRHRDYYVHFPTSELMGKKNLPTGKRKVDVKSTKGLRRDGDVEEGFVCLETHGTFGKMTDLNGWIFGNQDENIIAFHIVSINRFYLVTIEQLKQYLVALHDKKNIDLYSEAQIKKNKDDDYEPFVISKRPQLGKEKEKFMYVPLEHLLANVSYWIFE